MIEQTPSSISSFISLRKDGFAASKAINRVLIRAHIAPARSLNAEKSKAQFSS
jgi:hypothetical protein